jgi:hypothetical protein
MCHHIMLTGFMLKQLARIALVHAILICPAGLASAGEVGPEDQVACPEGSVCPEPPQKAESQECQAARRTIAAQGFGQIAKIECSGRYSVFTAWRLESFYIIRVSAKSGRIVSVEAQRIELWDQ